MGTKFSRGTCAVGEKIKERTKLAQSLQDELLLLLVVERVQMTSMFGTDKN